MGYMLLTVATKNVHMNWLNLSNFRLRENNNNKKVHIKCSPINVKRADVFIVPFAHGLFPNEIFVVIVKKFCAR